MPPARGKLTQKSDARARRAQTMDLDAPSAMHLQDARVAQQWPHPYTDRLTLTYSVLLHLRHGWNWSLSQFFERFQIPEHHSTRTIKQGQKLFTETSDMFFHKQFLPLAAEARHGKIPTKELPLDNGR